MLPSDPRAYTLDKDSEGDRSRGTSEAAARVLQGPIRDSPAGVNHGDRLTRCKGARRHTVGATLGVRFRVQLRGDNRELSALRPMRAARTDRGMVTLGDERQDDARQLGCSDAFSDFGWVAHVTYYCMAGTNVESPRSALGT